MRGTRTFLEKMVLLKAGVDMGASELGWKAWWLRKGDGVGVCRRELGGGTGLEGSRTVSPVQRQGLFAATR